MKCSTRSPGIPHSNTTGTDALLQLPTPLRVFMQRVIPRVGPIFGISYPLEVGTKRLVDGLIGGSSHCE